MKNVLDRIRNQFAEVGFEDGAPGVKSMTFKPTVDRENRLVKGLVSTESVDLDNEVVMQDGFDTSYFPEKVQAVYLDHMYTSMGTLQVAAVGVCRNLSPKKDGLYATTYVRPTPLGEDVLTAIEDGALSGFSIGFKVLSASAPTDDEQRRYPGARNIIRGSKLLEYSFTSMPANGDAKIKSLLDSGRIRRDSAVLMSSEIEAKAAWQPNKRRVVVVG
ncbi:MAG: hypothetical protein B7733_13045 [Myxococcales bacterium FL481]|nr:MAG: hypothetical protein B7733_13045 [Myxococcales bacterium FL481]